MELYNYYSPCKYCNSVTVLITVYIHFVRHCGNSFDKQSKRGIEVSSVILSEKVARQLVSVDTALQ